MVAPKIAATTLTYLAQHKSIPMKKSKIHKDHPTRTETLLTHGGREPAAHGGFVNMPAYRGSTIVFEDLASLDDHTIRHRYGRQGTPLTAGLEDIVTELEGAVGTCLAPNGVSAISLALMACLDAGDEVLITDSVYEPTRKLADKLLTRFGISARYFDPRIGAGIADLLGPATKAVFLESPGSLTFELQDIPAISSAVSGRDIGIIVDNSWATPLSCRPLALGADIVVHSGTKMFVGHSDAMLGTVSANEKHWPRILETAHALGIIASPDDSFLATRGMRTLGVRMKEHERRALDLARWLESQEIVTRVLHPALPSHPDKAIFDRDFSGSGSLFSFVLPLAERSVIAEFVDHLALFAMGYSWGGFESLILPFDPTKIRTATPWNEHGNAFRVHVGFEDMDDLKADLAAGLERYRKSLGT
ncbi:cystathionine beta-lyase [Pelagibacterium sediminicola]|uniref:cystathionine beta-lyase n=1 Tax=Pelagibacterium sediminicola TaxID=2248761 RepID=UPI001FEB7C25|nr:cystathionine beta-lyase [Pelagibacterium sediminicola]